MNKSQYSKDDLISGGFTLIELLVVIAILSILAVVVAIAINPAQKINQSKDAKIYSDIGQIAGVLQAYFTSSALTGSAAYYPSALTAIPNTYMGNVPKEPGGNDYYYHVKPPPSGQTPSAEIYYPSYNNSGGTICWDSPHGQVKFVTTTYTNFAGSNSTSDCQ